MKIQVIGVGVVGEARAYLATQLGHEVVGFDPKKTASPYARIVKEFDRDVDLTFVCTPESATESVIAELVRKDVKGLFVIESTVPPGTTRRLMEKHNIHICHNPEFLREKTPLEDVLNPSMIVIGQCCAAHGGILKDMYRPLGRPIVITQPTTSETVKLTINSYLATLISFWNEIDKLANALGLSTAEVARIARFNPRVCSYGTEFFGSPFGGKCLPKDLDQIIASFHQAGVNPELLEAVRDFNRKLK